MSWGLKAENEYVIITGDAKSYTVRWKNPSIGMEFNTSEFEFPGISGTLVQRGTAKGFKYAIEVYFQGDDNLDQAQAFRNSAQDSRPWIIYHPLYGTLNVQPISLFFDDSSLNVTKVTGNVIETIIEDKPIMSVDPVDDINERVENVSVRLADAYVLAVKTPDAKNIALIQANTDKIYKQGVKSINNTSDYEKYFNAFNVANSAIVQATSKPLEAIRRVQAMINLPFQFADTVKNRISTLAAQISLLRTSIANLLRMPDKKLYENNVGFIIATMAQASVTNYNYTNRVAVADVMDVIEAVYEQFLSDLDVLSNLNASSPDSYIPDADSMSQLSDLINVTLSNLVKISLNSKQERIHITDKETNIILLAHRLYGLQQDDSTVQQIIDDNNIGINEYLLIRQGRKIIYYI